MAKQKQQQSVIVGQSAVDEMRRRQDSVRDEIRDLMSSVHGEESRRMSLLEEKHIVLLPEVEAALHASGPFPTLDSKLAAALSKAGTCLLGRQINPRNERAALIRQVLKREDRPTPCSMYTTEHHTKYRRRDPRIFGLAEYRTEGRRLSGVRERTGVHPRRRVNNTGGCCPRGVFRMRLHTLVRRYFEAKKAQQGSRRIAKRRRAGPACIRWRATQSKGEELSRARLS